jgi:hypothetical protein
MSRTTQLPKAETAPLRSWSSCSSAPLNRYSLEVVFPGQPILNRLVMTPSLIQPMVQLVLGPMLDMTAHCLTDGSGRKHARPLSHHLGHDQQRREPACANCRAASFFRFSLSARSNEIAILIKSARGSITSHGRVPIHLIHRPGPPCLLTSCGFVIAPPEVEQSVLPTLERVRE